MHHVVSGPAATVENLGEARSTAVQAGGAIAILVALGLIGLILPGCGPPL